MSDLQSKSKEIIENIALSSYFIDPVAHYRDLTDKVPEIKTGLSTETINVTAKEYLKHDKDAIDYQRKYLKWQKRVFLLTFLSTCVGAIMVSYPAISKMLELDKKMPDNIVLFDDIILIILTVLIAVFSAIAIMAQHQITQRDLLKNWMSSRAKAESFRIQYFTLVTKVTQTENPEKDIFQTLLKLEYFVKFQLKVQIEYLEKRGNDHRRQYDKLKYRTSIGLGIVALISMISGISGITQTLYASLAFIGLIAGAFVAMKNEENTIFQYQRTFQRYESTGEILQELRNLLDQVRPKILSGDLSVLEEYVKTVNNCISTEHRQWLEIKDETNAIVTDLQKKLKN